MLLPAATHWMRLSSPICLISPPQRPLCALSTVRVTTGCMGVIGGAAGSTSVRAESGSAKPRSTWVGKRKGGARRGLSARRRGRSVRRRSGPQAGPEQLAGRLGDFRRPAPVGPCSRPGARTHDQTALPKAVMVAVVSVISTASESAGWPSRPGMVSVACARVAAGWADGTTTRRRGVAAAGALSDEAGVYGCGASSGRPAPWVVALLGARLHSARGLGPDAAGVR